VGLFSKKDKKRSKYKKGKFKQEEGSKLPEAMQKKASDMENPQSIYKRRNAPALARNKRSLQK